MFESESKTGGEEGERVETGVDEEVRGLGEDRVPVGCQLRMENAGSDMLDL